MTFSVIKTRSIWYTISAIMIVASIVLMVAFGLKQGIEFTGGTLLAARFDQRPSVADAESAVRGSVTDIGTVVVQPAGEKDIQFRFKSVSEDEHQAILKSLKDKFGTVSEMSYDQIGPTIGEELRTKSVQGLLIVLACIMAYVAYSFRKVSAPVQSWKYGLVTIFTAFHDVIVPLGVFAFLGHYYGWEIGTPFVAAILTILGYSITDTIVVMDRVRENLQKMSGTFSEIVDTSIRQTFLRSFNTSVSTLLSLVAIFLFGGSSLHEFTLALIIGIAVGTYSSLFVATPMLVTIEKLGRRLKR